MNGVDANGRLSNDGILIEGYLMKSIDLIRKRVEENRDYAKYLNTPLWQEFCEIADTANPKAKVEIEKIIVLSSNMTQLKKVARETENTDVNSDYDRARLGIQVAKEIAQLKLAKLNQSLSLQELEMHGPKIIYVGMQEQCDDFMLSIAGSDEMAALHTDYPFKNFQILSLKSHQISSKGKFYCLLDHMDFADATIGWITHAFHYPRVSHQLNQLVSEGIFPKNVNHYAFLVDRKFQSEGMVNNVIGELTRIPIYLEKGDLAQNPYAKIIFY